MSAVVYTTASGQQLQYQQQQQQQQQYQMMMPPQALTSGMPDPATIANQKTSYMHMLDEQVKQGTTVLEAQVKHQKDYDPIFIN